MHDSYVFIKGTKTLHIAMQIGLYHHHSDQRHRLKMSESCLAYSLWGFFWFHQLQNVSIAVFSSSSSAVIHLLSDCKNLSYATFLQMLSVFDQIRYLHKFRKITFLFRRQKTKSSKKWNNIFLNRGEIVNFVIPNAIRSTAQSATFQVPLEQSQNDLVFLRYVETQRDFPWIGIIFAFSKW